MMVRNAIRFNGADSEVGNIAVSVGNRVREMLAGMKAQNEAKKRKESEKPNGPPAAKKAKLA